MYVVEGEETDDGGQRRTSARDRPVIDQIELGLSRAIAIRSDVVANMLDAVGEKLALLQLKSNAILQKDITDTFKQQEKGRNNGRPQKDVVDDDAVAEMGSVSGMARTEKLSPFTLEHVHHASIESGSITRTKWHDTETMLPVIGSKKR